MKLARYWTHLDIRGTESTVQDLEEQFKHLDTLQVVTLASLIGVLLEIWHTVIGRQDSYRSFVVQMFDEATAKKILAHPDRGLFSRRQLLLMMKTAIRLMPDGYKPSGQKTVDQKFWRAFGEAALILNDRLTFGLAGTSRERSDLTKNIMLEMIPVVEDAGTSVLAKASRSMSMLLEIAPSLTTSPDFLNLSSEFQTETGFSIRVFHAFCFALLAKWSSAHQLIQNPDPLGAFLQGSWLSSTSISPDVTESILSKMSRDLPTFKQQFSNLAFEDVTPFRAAPLIKIGEIYCITDLNLVAEATEAMVFWTVNSRVDSQKLRRFWGRVFEKYLCTMLLENGNSRVNLVRENPEFTDTGEEACDLLVLYDDTAVLMEVKANMFTVAAKYSGNRDLFFREFEAKLVKNEQGKNKGATQLASTIEKLFKRGKSLKGISLGHIKTVIPAVITLESVGDVPVFSRVLEQYLPSQAIRGTSPPAILPILGMSVNTFEALASFVDEIPLAVLLKDWIQHDPIRNNNYFMFDSEIKRLLGNRRNAFLDKRFKTVAEASAKELFPGVSQ